MAAPRNHAATAIQVLTQCNPICRCVFVDVQRGVKQAPTVRYAVSLSHYRPGRCTHCDKNEPREIADCPWPLDVCVSDYYAMLKTAHRPRPHGRRCCCRNQHTLLARFLYLYDNRFSFYRRVGACISSAPAAQVTSRGRSYSVLVTQHLVRYGNSDSFIILSIGSLAVMLTRIQPSRPRLILRPRTTSTKSARTGGRT